MTTLNLYSKDQVDAKVPDTTGANVGDVLTVGASGNEWATPSGAGTTTALTSAAEIVAWLTGINPGDRLIGESIKDSFNRETGLFDLRYYYNKTVGSTTTYTFGGSMGICKSGSNYYNFQYFEIDVTSTGSKYRARITGYGYQDRLSYFDYDDTQITSITNLIGIKY